MTTNFFWNLEQVFFPLWISCHTLLVQVFHLAFMLQSLVNQSRSQVPDTLPSELGVYIVGRKPTGSGDSIPLTSSRTDLPAKV